MANFYHPMISHWWVIVIPRFYVSKNMGQREQLKSWSWIGLHLHIYIQVLSIRQQDRENTMEATLELLLLLTGMSNSLSYT